VNVDVEENKMKAMKIKIALIGVISFLLMSSVEIYASTGSADAIAGVVGARTDAATQTAQENATKKERYETAKKALITATTKWRDKTFNLNYAGNYWKSVSSRVALFGWFTGTGDRTDSRVFADKLKSGEATYDQFQAFSKEFIGKSFEAENEIKRLYEEFNTARQDVRDNRISVASDSYYTKDLNGWMATGGLVKVDHAEISGTYYARDMWNQVKGAVRVHGRDVRNMTELEREVLLKGRPATRVYRQGERSTSSTGSQFVMILGDDGDILRLNCGTGDLSPDSRGSIKKESEHWGKTLAKGLLTFAVVGGELYRPYLQNKQQKEAWKGWRDSSIFAQNYGYPVPPMPLLPPIAPVNLNPIFNLLGMGPQMSPYEKMMFGMYGGNSQFMQGGNPMMQNQMQMYQMQMMQRQMMNNGINPQTGQPFSNNPVLGLQNGLQNMMGQIPQQLQSLQNMTTQLNEELVIRRQNMANQMKSIMQLEAAANQVQRLGIPALGELNKLNSAWRGLQRAANSHFNNSQSQRYEMTYNRSGNSGGRYGYQGNNPWGQ
jgi:hypothetical protein